MSGTLRCAYCHDAAHGDVVRCSGCGTVLHPDCLREVWPCPTLGCAPRRASCGEVDRPLGPVANGLLRVIGWLGRL